MALAEEGKKEEPAIATKIRHVMDDVEMTDEEEEFKRLRKEESELMLNQMRVQKQQQQYMMQEQREPVELSVGMTQEN